MAKDGSVAPKERVNIVYQPSSEGSEEVELPLKILSIGDYTGREDDRPVEERKPINIDKENFDDVLSQHNVGADISVPNKLEDNAEGDLSVSLSFKTMKDFSPEGILNQVPELQQMMELRNALTALKSPLGNKPAFRKRLQQIMNDTSSRDQLLSELGLGDSEDDDPPQDNQN